MSLYGRGGRYGEWHSTRLTSQKNGLSRGCSIQVFRTTSAAAAPSSVCARAPSSSHRAAFQRGRGGGGGWLRALRTSRNSSKPVANPVVFEIHAFALTARVS